MFNLIVKIGIYLIYLYFLDESNEDKSSGSSDSTSLIPCPYCSRKIINIGRHVVINHKSEEKVKKIMELPKTSLERKKLCQDLKIPPEFDESKI